MESVINLPHQTQLFRAKLLSHLGTKLGISILIGLSVFSSVSAFYLYQNYQASQRTLLQTSQDRDTLQTDLTKTKEELTTVLNEDQVVKNKQLLAHINQIEKGFSGLVALYERLLDLKGNQANTAKADEILADTLSAIGKFNYDQAQISQATLSAEVTKLEQEIAQKAAVPPPAAAVTSNVAPGSGYSRQKVSTEIGEYVVSLVAGDMGSTRVIVDTASGSDCKNDCPVLALGDYVARNGGYAGINGTYFCPASYPTCADKKNSFDLLVMNKDKVYFNSDNNVYSNNPAVVFMSGSMRFVGAASQWGRDTGVDGVLSNYPLLVSGSEVRFGGDGDPKKGSKGNRSFVANKGSVAYIGVVHSATVAEAAVALKALGMENALNLDSGGSTALWSGGYKVGPGRAIPNAIIFVRK